jgi:hypothetical protein
MMRKIKLLGGLLLAAAMVACGGGGGSPGTTPGNDGTPPAPVAASVEVFTSATELSSAANSSVTFTVVAKDANNQAIPSQTVTFTATSGSLIGALPIPQTGAAGEPITAVSLTPGADRTNRNITVTVMAGTANRQVVIPVVGTTLTVTGNSSLLLGGTASYTVRALDSANAPVPGAAITLTSSAGNAVSPATVTTDSQGIATFTYVGTNAGTDTLRVSGLGTSTSTTVGISSDLFQFEAPASGASVAVGGTQTVTVRFQRSGVAVANQTVTFSTTRGSIAPATAVTNDQGRASAIISSNSAGPGNIVAQTPSAQVTLPVSFVATNAASIVLQANPGAIPPNAANSTSNRVTLLATVRDAAGNAVSGRIVNFTAVVDRSNGTITPGSATTDSAGNAQVQFIPGSLATANNGVVISATVAGTAISSQSTVTVNAEALFISIATSNVISNLNPQTYEKEFSVYVTDANGAPAANRVVNLEVFPLYYLTGTYREKVLDSAGEVIPGWTRQATGACINEDLDRDGILDPGEDESGNGRLEPGLPVVVTPASVTTSSNGFATFKLQYGENYAGWVQTEITARTSVGGTESVKRQEYFLIPSLEDMSAPSTPANQTSPFGAAAISCTPP